MIFRLDRDGLYIHSQEGEIVLRDNDGMFKRGRTKTVPNFDLNLLTNK